MRSDADCSGLPTFCTPTLQSATTTKYTISTPQKRSSQALVRAYLSAGTSSGSHSNSKTCHFGPNVSVTVLAFCMDNYCYVIVDHVCNTAVIVDPGDAYPVIKFFSEHQNIKPVAVLCTHKHWDHCAGNYLLVQKYPHLQIFASEDDSAYLSNRSFRDSERLPLEGLHFRSASVVAYEMPGHTVGHALFCVSVSDSSEQKMTKSTSTAGQQGPTNHHPMPSQLEVFSGANNYSGNRNDESESTSPAVIQSQPQSNGTNEKQSESTISFSAEMHAPPLLFTGDCLFLNGMGKMFECPSVVMAATLQRIVDKFPDDTLLFPGHEYTLNFIHFTLTLDIDPYNSHVRQRLKEVQGQIDRRQPSVPARLGLEKQCNPFLRTTQLSRENGPLFAGKTSADIIQILADKKSDFSKVIAASISNSSSIS